MKKFLTIFSGTLRILLRTRQTMLFTFFVPLFIMIVIGYVTGSGESTLVLGVVGRSDNSDITTVMATLQKVEAFDVRVGNLEDEKAALGRSERDALIVFPDDFSFQKARDSSQIVTLYENVGNPIQTRIAESVLQDMFQKFQNQQSGVSPWFLFEKKQVQSFDIRYVDFLTYGIIGMTIMQLGIFSTAFAIVEARTHGVLKRVMATPIAPWHYVLGNMMARLVISLGQSAVIILVAVLLFDVKVGNWNWLAPLIILGNLVFLSLGLFISGIAKTVESVPIIGNLVVFPMLLLGNVFFSTASLPNWLRLIVDRLPIALLTDLLRDTVVLNQSFGEVWSSLLWLVAWAVVALFLANSFFKLQEKD